MLDVSKMYVQYNTREICLLVSLFKICLVSCQLELELDFFSIRKRGEVVSLNHYYFICHFLP